MSERPRLLFVAPWFLFPTSSGGQIRTVDILRGMKGGAFDITLVSPAAPAGSDWDAAIDGICDRFVSWEDDTSRTTLSRVRSLASRLPVSVALDRSPAARRCIAAEVARSADVIVVDFVHTAVLMPDDVRVPTAIFTHNVEAEIYQRHASGASNAAKKAVWSRQAKKMARFEREALRAVQTVVAVSDRDGEMFRDRFGIENVRVIPTGVDLEFFKFAEERRPGDLRDAGGAIVFTGSMNWLPNVEGLDWFLARCWPQVQEGSAATKMTVVGRNPAPKLVTAAERAAVPWTFTGFVDDVRPYVYESDVAVIPLRVGGGTRLKAFEAMSLGLPVVSTTIGVEGLPLEPDTHYLRADSPEDFAKAVLRLLSDEDLRERLRRAAYRFVADNFSSKAVAREFEKICLDTLELAGSKAG